jgi:hypothetical protein
VGCHALAQVAERLGVRSMRRQMLAESAAGVQLGLAAGSGAEAFGQVGVSQVLGLVGPLQLL